MNTTPLVPPPQVYLVQDGRPLTLEIIIGDEQSGGTSLIWNSSSIEIPPIA